MKKNTVTFILSSLVIFFILSACGKKAPLRPPSSDKPPLEKPDTRNLGDFFNGE